MPAPDNAMRLSALHSLCREGDEKKPLPAAQGEGRTPTLALPLEGGGNLSSGAASAAPSFIISERRGLTIINLRGNPARSEFLASARERLGGELPLTPNCSTAVGGGVILNLGPDEWLLIGAQFSESLAIESGFPTDVSHGRCSLRIRGERIRDLLAKGCSLDLHPRAFKPGQCVQTSIARVSVVLHLLESGNEVDLYCARSYAGSLWHWLTEAAAEFGYAVPSD